MPDPLPTHVPGLCYYFWFASVSYLCHILTMKINPQGSLLSVGGGRAFRLGAGLPLWWPVGAKSWWVGSLDCRASSLIILPFLSKRAVLSPCKEECGGLLLEVDQSVHYERGGLNSGLACTVSNCWGTLKWLYI